MLPGTEWKSIRETSSQATGQTTFVHSRLSSPCHCVLAGPPSHGEDVSVCVFDMNQPSLPTPLYSVLMSISVFMALSTVFHFIKSPDNSPLSHSVLRAFIGPFNCVSLYESTLEP